MMKGARAGAPILLQTTRLVGENHSLAAPCPLKAALGLIVSTHRALYATNAEAPARCMRLVSTGFGHYYGAVPVVDGGAWLLVGSQARSAASLRSNSTGLPRGKDALLLVHDGGETAAAWVLHTEYLHDTTRADDGLVYAVDSATGGVGEYAVEVAAIVGDAPGWLALPQPEGESGVARVTLRRTISTVPLLSGPPGVAHANNVLATRGQLWVMHHNLRSRSMLHVFDRPSGRRVKVFVLGGSECHNPLFYKGEVLYLMSAVGGLATLRRSGRSSTLWAAGSGWFSKGLAVVDDVAFFGVSLKAARGDRNRVAAELVAYDLRARTVRSRTPLPQPGLVNAISAPRLAPTCSWRACDTGIADADLASGRHEPDPEAWQLVGVKGGGSAGAGVNRKGQSLWSRARAWLG